MMAPCSIQHFESESMELCGSGPNAAISKILCPSCTFSLSSGGGKDEGGTETSLSPSPACPEQQIPGQMGARHHAGRVPSHP